MVTFLDFLFFVCCSFYKRREKNDFRISGLILLSTVFELNVVLVTLVLSSRCRELFTISTVYASRYYIVGACILVFVSVLYIRYFRITSYDEVDDRIQRMSDTKKYFFGLLAILYVVASFIVTISYAIMFTRITGH